MRLQAGLAESAEALTGMQRALDERGRKLAAAEARADRAAAAAAEAEAAAAELRAQLAQCVLLLQALGLLGCLPTCWGSSVNMHEHELRCIEMRKVMDFVLVVLTVYIFTVNRSIF